MSNIVQAEKFESALINGNLAGLTAEERLSYYKKVCESVGLNPLTKPFEYIPLNGKLVLYANKGCAEQLRSIHQISIKIVDKQKIDDVFIVTAEAFGKDGRIDSSTGAVPVANLKGEALANAMLKCETKAKRRVTLSICGLNMLDETEVESINKVAEIEPEPVQPETAKVSIVSRIHGPQNHRPITKDEYEKLLALKAEVKMSAEMLKEIIKLIFRVDQARDLKLYQYHQLVVSMNSLSPEKLLQQAKDAASQREM